MLLCSNLFIYAGFKRIYDKKNVIKIIEFNILNTYSELNFTKKEHVLLRPVY